MKKGSRRRRIQTVPIGSTQLFLNMKVQRYRCNKCGHNGYEKVRFVFGNRCYTHKLAKHVVILLRCMTIQDVAKMLHLSWDVVKETHLKHLERRYRRPSLNGVESIGIDESAVRSGHVYKTIVVDLISALSIRQTTAWSVVNPPLDKGNLSSLPSQHIKMRISLDYHAESRSLPYALHSKRKRIFVTRISELSKSMPAPHLTFGNKGVTHLPSSHASTSLATSRRKGGATTTPHTPHHASQVTTSHRKRGRHSPYLYCNPLC